MDQNKVKDINAEAASYIETMRKQLRVLSGEWDDLATEAPQKFMQLLKSGMKPNIQRGNSGGGQLNISLNFEMNTDGAKAYIEEVRVEIERLTEAFKSNLEDINSKLKHYENTDINNKSFSLLVKLFSDYISFLDTAEIDFQGRKISPEITQDTRDTLNHWKEVDKARTEEAEAKRLGVDVKDIANHQTYLEAKRKYETAKTSAAMLQTVKLFHSIAGYLDADTYADNARGKVKELREKEAEAERLRQEEEERRKAEEELLRKEGIYTAAKAAMNDAKTVEEFDQVINELNSIPNYKDANDLVHACKEKSKEIFNETTYANAISAMSLATLEGYKEAIQMFNKVSGYKDANDKVNECHDKVQEIENDATYEKALNALNTDTKESYQEALALFDQIKGYKDADEKAKLCKEKVEYFEEQEATELRLAQEKEEQERRAKLEALYQKRRKKEKTMTLISLISIVVIVISILIPFVKNSVIPSMNYNKAMNLLEKHQYEEAYTVFEKLGSFKDSQNMLSETRYQQAQYCYETQEYEVAITLYEQLESYEESKTKLKQTRHDYGQYLYNQANYEKAVEVLTPVKNTTESKELYNESVYSLGIWYFGQGKYQEGYDTLYGIRTYKDAKDQAYELYYQAGLKLYQENKFEESNVIFKKLAMYGYKDSSSLIHTHVFTENVLSVLSCTVDGKVVKTCGCGHSETIDTAAPGHKYTEATCTAASKCSACGLEQSPALGHDIQANVCTRCNHIFIDPITFTGSSTNINQENKHLICVPKGTYKFTITANPTTSTQRWSVKVNGSSLSYGYSSTNKKGTFEVTKYISKDNTDSEIIVKIVGSYKLVVEPVNK